MNLNFIFIISGLSVSVLLGYTTLEVIEDYLVEEDIEYKIWSDTY